MSNIITQIPDYDTVKQWYDQQYPSAINNIATSFAHSVSPFLNGETESLNFSPEWNKQVRQAHKDNKPIVRYEHKQQRKIDRATKQYENSIQGVKKFFNSSKGQQTLNAFGSILGSTSGNDLPEGDKAVREGIRSTIGQFGPWGAAIAAASGVVDAVGDMTETNLGSIDINAAKRAGVKGGAMFNKIMNMIPGNSMVWGIMGGDTATAHMSTDSLEMAHGYTGSMQTLQDAQALGDKRMLFGKRKANRFVKAANKMNETLTEMNLERKRMESNYAPQLYATNNQMIYNGYTPGLTLHKRGGTIPELDDVRSIMQSLQSKKQEIQEPQKFQLGGKMNMIVTGALHARKHNLEELNPVLEGEITKKGIPVITFDEGGEVDQQLAEVEQAEIVMTLDTTKTIEDYYKEYMDADTNKEADQAALECGKFLVDQILKNTDDPDKLIKKTK